MNQPSKWLESVSAHMYVPLRCGYSSIIDTDSVWEKKKKKRLNFNPAYGREENSDNPRQTVGIEGLACIRIIWGGGFS